MSSSQGRPAPDMAVAADEPTVGGEPAARTSSRPNPWARLMTTRAREMRLLPLMAGLVVMAGFFQIQNSAFLSAANLVNLSVQMAGVTTVALGVVFVLLIGEIDLSVGFVSGLGTAVSALLLVDVGLPALLAIVLAVAMGAAVGAIQGAIITFVRIPSFVVTLAGFLGWQGVIFLLLQERGTVIVEDPLYLALANGFLPPWLAWILLGGFVLIAAWSHIQKMRRRRAAGLETGNLLGIASQIGVTAGLGVVAVYVLNRDRGVAYAFLIVVVLATVLTYIAERTRFGRHIYAVGGSAKTARRAGVEVRRIRITMFMIAGALAALGGVILGSRLRAAVVGAGGGSLLLFALAAAIIGGVSLYGGRGRVFGAAFGGLVIATVDNGMGLMGLSTGMKFVVTAAVLLMAVTVDALGKRQSAVGE